MDHSYLAPASARCPAAPPNNQDSLTISIENTFAANLAVETVGYPCRSGSNGGYYCLRLDGLASAESAIGMEIPVLTEALKDSSLLQIDCIRINMTGYHLNLLHSKSANVLRSDGHVEPWGTGDFHKNGWAGCQAYIDGTLTGL